MGAGRQGEGGELAGVGPDLLVDDGDVGDGAAGAVGGVDVEAVPHPGHDLLLAAHHAAEPQRVGGQLLVLGLPQRPPAQLLDVLVPHVRDRVPPAQQRAAAAQRRRAGDWGDGEGGRGKGGQDEEEEREVVAGRRHGLSDRGLWERRGGRSRDAGVARSGRRDRLLVLPWKTVRGHGI